MAAKTPRAKPQTTASPAPSVLKTGSCPSLTGASTLTYEIGTAAGGIVFRITGNSGGGLFGKEWVPWSALQPVLATDPVIHGGHAEASGGLRGQSPNPPALCGLCSLKPKDWRRPWRSRGISMPIPPP